MTTQKEMTRINEMVQIIERNGIISKVQLVMQSRISISYYDKLKPYMEEIYNHKVRYDKESKTWHAVEQDHVLTD
jgi:hypothetical protein